MRFFRDEEASAGTGGRPGLSNAVAGLLRSIAAGATRGVIAGIISALIPAVSDSQGFPARPRLQAEPAARAPVIDGVLDDAAWQQSPAVRDLIQYQPRLGDPASARTAVWVTFDSTHLYVAMRAWDEAPVTAQLTRRDADLAQDDFFAVILDTHGDRQSGYLFALNPLGTQSDSRLANDGATEEKAWDAPWASAARILDDGWTAELAIPFNSLRYRPGNGRTWGINFGRGRRRNLELAFWTGPLEHPLRVSQAGELAGLVLPRVTRSFTGIAYGLARAEEGRETAWDAGLDVRWALGAGASFVGTVNPDFATIEADREQVNLTRFELSLPEKRPFFLEGAELFRQRIQTFYSRRMADIRAGGRVVGKTGAWTYAMLAADAVSSNGGADPTFAVARLQRDIGRSSVGFTWADRRLGGDASGSAGFNANLFFTPVFSFTGQLIQSYGAYDEGTWAWFVRPSWDTPKSHFHVRYTHLGERFGDHANSVGLIRDDDRREFDSALERTIWVASGALEQVRYSSNYNIYWGQTGTLRSWQVDQGLSAEFRNRWSARVNYTEEYKLFEKEFQNRSTALTVGYNTRAYASASAGIAAGRNFDADFRLATTTVRLKPSAALSLEYNLQRLWLDPDPRNATTWIHVVSASQFFTNDLYLQLFYQTNSAIDRRNLQAVFVYRYAPPFGTVQLAFQRGTAAFGQASQQGNTLFLKATRIF